MLVVLVYVCVSISPRLRHDVSYYLCLRFCLFVLLFISHCCSTWYWYSVVHMVVFVLLVHVCVQFPTAASAATCVFFFVCLFVCIFVCSTWYCRCCSTCFCCWYTCVSTSPRSRQLLVFVFLFLFCLLFVCLHHIVGVHGID